MSDKNEMIGEVYQSAEETINNFKITQKEFVSAKEKLISENIRISKSISRLKEIQSKIESLLEFENESQNTETINDELEVTQELESDSKNKSIEEKEENSSMKESDNENETKKKPTKTRKTNTKNETISSKSVAAPKNRVVAEEDADGDVDDFVLRNKDKNVESFITDDGLFDSEDIDSIKF